MIVQFQDRVFDVDPKEFSIDRKGKGWKCYRHNRSLESKRNVETHMKVDHWPDLCEKWKDGRPVH